MPFRILHAITPVAIERVLRFFQNFATHFAILLSTALRFSSTPPVWTLLTRAVQIASLAFLSLTIRHWISLRFRSFTVAVAAGVGAMMTSDAVLPGVGRNTTSWLLFFPWAVPMTRLMSNPAANVNMFLTYSIVVGLAAALIGCADFCRRDAS